MDEGAPALAKARQDHLRMELPPGFRFQPTDEELITHYLAKKVTDASFHAVAIAEVDLNKHEPWDLPLRGKMGEKEWYFFCVRDRKYPTGLRTNRATKAGYWKATGKDTAIYRGKSLVGMKKTLVFYRGRAPKGEKSDWVMHEYRLEGKYSVFNLPPTVAKQNEWVVCRVFHKMAPGFKKPTKTEAPLPPPLMTQANAGNSSSSSSNNNNNRASHSTFDSAYVTCFSNAPGTNDGEHFRSPLLFASAEPLLLSVLSSGAVQLPRCASLSMAQRQMSCVSQDSTGLTAEMNHPEISSPVSIDGRGGGQGLAALAGHSILLPDHSLWNC